MKIKALNEYTYDQLQALVKEHGSGRNAAKFLNIARTTFQDYMKRVQENIFRSRQLVKTIKIAPAKGVKRFILTSAQDGTHLHEEFFHNLEVYAEYIGAEIMIAGYTYNKSLFEEHSKKKVYWPSAVEKYLTNDRYNLGPNLVWCAEMNTLPTAVSPLSGFESYTGPKSGIFPHAKVQLLSIATMKSAPAKIIMTTGTVTKPNYVAKRAGIKAEFHHIIGAVIVELLADGQHFCRHLLADKDGNFQDLTRLVKDGAVSEGHSVEAITHGDIHYEKLNGTMATNHWGPSKYGLYDGELADIPIVDALKPRFQFFHDLPDFEARNHHSIKNPHHVFDMHVRKREAIEEQFSGMALLLEETAREDCESIVIESNHDLAFVRWLQSADYRDDPVNAEFFLRSQLACYEAIREGNKRFSIFEHAMRDLGGDAIANVRFLREDESFLTCAWDKGGIENGLHGHLGPDGSRGSVKSFTKLGPRTNSAHGHKGMIIDGAYAAGVMGNLDMGYNRGPSAWNHTDIITYPNGKRTLVTFSSDGAWRAPL